MTWTCLKQDMFVVVFVNGRAGKPSLTLGASEEGIIPLFDFRKVCVSVFGAYIIFKTDMNWPETSI